VPETHHPALHSDLYSLAHVQDLVDLAQDPVRECLAQDPDHECLAQDPDHECLAQDPVLVCLALDPVHECLDHVRGAEVVRVRDRALFLLALVQVVARDQSRAPNLDHDVQGAEVPRVRNRVLVQALVCLAQDPVHKYLDRAREVIQVRDRALVPDQVVAHRDQSRAPNLDHDVQGAEVPRVLNRVLDQALVEDVDSALKPARH